jgi:hypothetical protein
MGMGWLGYPNYSLATVERVGLWVHTDAGALGPSALVLQEVAGQGGGRNEVVGERFLVSGMYTCRAVVEGK